jgi:RNA polymerase-binding transcription factor DksA
VGESEFLTRYESIYNIKGAARMDESGYGLKEICIDCGNEILFFDGD